MTDQEREKRKSRWQSIKNKHSTDATSSSSDRPAIPTEDLEDGLELPEDWDTMTKKVANPVNTQEPKEKKTADSTNKEEDEEDEDDDGSENDSDDEMLEDEETLEKLTKSELQAELQKPKSPTETIFQVINKINYITNKLNLGHDDNLKVESVYFMCANEIGVLEHLNAQQGLWAFPDGSVNWNNFVKSAMEFENYSQQMKLLNTNNNNPVVVWDTLDDNNNEESEHVKKYFADKTKGKIQRKRKILQSPIEKEKIRKKRKKEVNK